MMGLFRHMTLHYVIRVSRIHKNGLYGYELESIKNLNFKSGIPTVMTVWSLEHLSIK